MKFLPFYSIRGSKKMFSGNFLHKLHSVLISAFILLDPIRIKLATFLRTWNKLDQDPYSSFFSLYVNKVSQNWTNLNIEWQERSINITFSKAKFFFRFHWEEFQNPMYETSPEFTLLLLPIQHCHPAIDSHLKSNTQHSFLHILLCAQHQ